MGKPRPATDDELQVAVTEIQCIANRLGYTPTAAEYTEHRKPSTPSQYTILRRLHRWSILCEMAGLKPRRRGGARMPGQKQKARPRGPCECDSGAPIRNWADVTVFTASNLELTVSLGLCDECYQVFQREEGR